MTQGRRGTARYAGWSTRLSAGAREIWDQFDRPERAWALQQSRCDEVVAEPELALVVGELQMIRAHMFRHDRWMVWVHVVWLASSIALALTRSWGWWLTSAAVALLLYQQLSRPDFASFGRANLDHAREAGLATSHRWR